MYVYCTKHFVKLATKADITDNSLREAIARAEAGKIDAKLASGLIKQRIARENGGKSGGFRSIVLYKRGEIGVYLHLFPKSQQANLDADEKKVYRKLAKFFDELTPVKISELLKSGELKEIEYDSDKEGGEVPE